MDGMIRTTLTPETTLSRTVERALLRLGKDCDCVRLFDCAVCTVVSCADLAQKGLFFRSSFLPFTERFLSYVVLNADFFALARLVNRWEVFLCVFFYYYFLFPKTFVFHFGSFQTGHDYGPGLGGVAMTEWTK